MGFYTNNDQIIVTSPDGKEIARSAFLDAEAGDRIVVSSFPEDACSLVVESTAHGLAVHANASARAFDGRQMTSEDLIYPEAPPR